MQNSLDQHNCIDMPFDNEKVLIVGCGDLGIRAATLLARAGAQVFGARRNISALTQPVKPLYMDLTKPETLAVVNEHCWHAIIITLTADEFTDAAYRATYVEGLKQLLQAISSTSTDGTGSNVAKPLLLFASSTSVYGQSDGSWVDERAPTQPSSFSGSAMLAAEQLLADSDCPSICIRYAGIYGPGRGMRLITQIRQGNICRAKPVRYSNRIHVEDCARVLVFLIQRQRLQLGDQHDHSQTYVAVDSEPVELNQVMQWIAVELGVDPATLQAVEPPSRGGSKRCSNARLLAAGFKFDYPNYRTGYRPLLTVQ